MSATLILAINLQYLSSGNFREVNVHVIFFKFSNEVFPWTFSKFSLKQDSYWNMSYIGYLHKYGVLFFYLLYVCFFKFILIDVKAMNSTLPRSGCFKSRCIGNIY
jgi:hypothetical protein